MKQMMVHLNKKTLRLIIIGAVFLLGAYVLYVVRGIMLPFVLAIILSYILNPLVVSLENLKFSRISSLVIIYIIGMLALTVAFVYGIPVIVRELTELGSAIPRITLEIQGFISSVYDRYRNIPIPASINQVFNNSIKDAEIVLIQGIQTTLNTVLSFFSNLLSFILAPILAFYILKDWKHIGRRVMAFFPLKWRESLAGLGEDIDRVLTGFIRGNLLDAVIVGILTGIGLSLVGMDYVILLSILTGITNLIPYFGAIIAAVPVLVLAFLKSTTLALQALIVMVVVQQIESNIVAPVVLGESVGLHPIAIVFALLAGGSLFGVWGLLLGVPVAAVIRIIFCYIYSNLIL